jgi:hypothetical protein
VEFLKLVVGSFEGALIVEAANSHLIDHGLANQILLRDLNIGVTDRALALLRSAGLAQSVSAGVEPHRIPHHLAALGAVEMLGVGWIHKLELAARLFLYFLDRVLDAADASCLAHQCYNIFMNRTALL